MGYVNLSRMPSAPKTRVINVQNLRGGLNIHEMPWHLRTDQSPDMKNMWWEDGALRARPGIMACNTGMIVDREDSSAHVFSDLRCYSHLFHGWYVFCNPNRGTFTVMAEKDRDIWMDLNGDDGEVFPVEHTDGAFFTYGNALYYKSAGGYYRIAATDAVEPDTGLLVLQAENVEPYVPTTYMNAVPSTGEQQFGGGDFYQPYNRLSLKRRILYSCGADTEYVVIPEVAEGDIVTEYVQEDGSWASLSASGTTAHADRTVLQFAENALGQALTDAGTAEVTNNVRVTYSVAMAGHAKTQYDSIMGCRIVEVFGGSSGLCVVMAGYSEQPNAYFWSGNTDVAMDPGYFPEEHYNLAGDVTDPITAFGKQQNMLVIFQKRQIGRTAFSTTDVDGRTLITMDYTVISPRIGCDFPRTVQLVENNLVFCNSRHGVMFLKDTSSAYENNIVPISQNIEKPSTHGGLLYDLSRAKERDVTTVDDSSRYWVLVGNHCWMWDYSQGGAVNDPKTLSWFLWDGVSEPACWFGEEEEDIPKYVGTDGYLRELTSQPEGTEEVGTGDYVRKDDNGLWLTRCPNFEKVLTLPSQDFGTFEVLKNVDKVIFEVLASGHGVIDIEYETDYEVRKDQTPITTAGWSWVPRNLALRSYMVFRFAATAIRRPRCIAVRHFLVRLRNRTLGQELSFVSAQIFYTLRGVDR